MRSADTIVAVSSPPGRSRRGMIRVAGLDAAAVADAILEHAPPTTTRRIAPARLRATPTPTPTPAHTPPPPTTPHPLPEVPVLAAWFPGPGSYCGDDTLELQLPGHPALLERVLRCCMNHGARLAEPGEFTFRAFAAGKLDLLGAEGIAATIAARSDQQLRAAEALRCGELGRFTTDAVEELATLLALVEAGIDFTDQEDVVPIPPGVLLQRINALREHVDRLLRRARSWGAVEALPRVVLAGPPSTGKSALFNALLGQHRAVIDAQPGTTRDVLEAPVTLPDGSEVMLVDLAGLDDAASLLDRAAQTRARKAVARADVVLQLGPMPTTPTGNAVVLPVQSRCDEEASPQPPPKTATRALRVSSVTGQGLDALRAALADALGRRDAPPPPTASSTSTSTGTAAADATTASASETLALQPRHEAALRDAAEALRHAAKTLGPQTRALPHPELTALSLRNALDALGGLGGTMTPDDVIGRVFATFCVGK